MRTLFCNGVFHSNVSQNDEFSFMLVENGRIAGVWKSDPELEGVRRVELGGKHVYPCLIDSHAHLMMTIGVLASGFDACEIAPSGIEPHDIEGVGKRISEYSSKQKGDVIAINNYVVTAIKERRLPHREELDSWCNGKAVVVYNIDGHSCALSTKMLSRIGIDPEGHDGILEGEANESVQGRIFDVVSSSIGLGALARGVGLIHNSCAEYGIGMVCTLEGNADSPKDITTHLIARLSRHFGFGVRLYLQYTDYDRVRRFERFLGRKRVGGCGQWEMDGSVGSHSAAFEEPYIDNGKTAGCYFTQEQVNGFVRKFNENGYQITSHAIGTKAIERLVTAYENLGPTTSNVGLPHRIDHCEFCDSELLKRISGADYSVTMQPGYAWVDKRYLHTYEEHLEPSIVDGLMMKDFFDSNVCVCGSSDSPVQELNPYLQMQGMTDFYNPSQSITPYQAFRSYTYNAAKSLGELDDYGTLEVGKVADFFVSEDDFFKMDPKKTMDFRPSATYYGGKLFKRWKGSVLELVCMMMRPARKI